MKTRISVASAIPGMRLAKAVLDDSGRLLVPDGTMLTESLLLGLQRRGVGDLFINQPEEEDPAEREATRARVSRSVAIRFRHAGDGPGSKALQEAILAFRMERGE